MEDIYGRYMNATRHRPTADELEAELDLIAQLLADNPDGLSNSAIAGLARTKLGRRLEPATIRRRLTDLEARGRVVAVGERKGRRYRPAATPAPQPTTDGAVPELLTSGTRRILEGVRRPLPHRAPVGYDRSLLEDYVPGKSWYLPNDIRERLRESGRTPEVDRPAGTFARDIHARLLIDLSWASSRLEGNTYSRLDTQKLIDFGQAAEGKDLREAQMILNHKTAIEYLIDDAERIDFDRTTLVALHAMLSENLLGNPADEGRLRTTPVGIGQSTYVPLAIPQLIEELFDRMLAVARAIDDPFEQSFFVMVHLPYLQPFIDVNKRTSRLAANIPLIRKNLCPLSFVDVPHDTYVESLLAVYELKRLEPMRELFVWAYERSCTQYQVVRESLPAPDPTRTRYRDALGEAARATVLDGATPSKAWLRTWAEENGVSAEDLDRFAETALDVITNLNEGSAARYRIRPSELAAWRARFAARE